MSFPYVPPMIVACWTAADSLLSTLAPLGLAAASETALVVDADRHGPRYPSPGSLADLVATGPRRIELSPQRTGIAVLQNGGVDLADALEVIEALGEGWPNLVVRLPSERNQPRRLAGRWPVIPVVPILPYEYGQPLTAPFVSQATGLATSDGSGAAITLPSPSRRTVVGLLSGRSVPGSRWVRAWRRAWEMAW